MNLYLFIVLQLSIVCVGVVCQSTKQSVMPVIGVLGLPSPDCDSLFSPSRVAAASNNHSVSCFTAFYVKWLEAAGARVVPVPASLDDHQVEQFYAKLNGLLFTGGGLSLDPAAPSDYYKTASKFYQMALRNTPDWPIWGTCQGFQLINILAADNAAVLTSGFDSEHLGLPLNFTTDAPTSRLYGSLPASVYATLATQDVTVNLHHEGVTPTNFHKFGASKQLTILSTNRDRKGREFISSVESKTHPIFGITFFYRNS
jgi:gamma-glutamyl hydrolase